MEPRNSRVFNGRRHLPPANSAGMGDILVRGVQVLSAGAPLLSVATMRGSGGSLPQEVGPELFDRIRFPRRPRPRSKDLLGPNVDSAQKALGYLRKADTETDDGLARSFAKRRGFVFEAASDDGEGGQAYHGFGRTDAWSRRCSWRTFESHRAHQGRRPERCGYLICADGRRRGDPGPDQKTVLPGHLNDRGRRVHTNFR